MLRIFLEYYHLKPLCAQTGLDSAKHFLPGVSQLIVPNIGVHRYHLNSIQMYLKSNTVTVQPIFSLVFCIQWLNLKAGKLTISWIKSSNCFILTQCTCCIMYFLLPFSLKARHLILKMAKMYSEGNGKFIKLKFSNLNNISVA